MQWVQVIGEKQVFYQRMVSHHQTLPETLIRRPLSGIQEEKIAKEQFESGGGDGRKVIRPFLARIPTATKITVSVSVRNAYSLDLFKRLAMGFVLRAGCSVSFPDLHVVVHLIEGYESKSQDCCLGPNTIVEWFQKEVKPVPELVPNLESIASLPSDSPSLKLIELVYTLTNFKKSIASLGIDLPSGILLYGPPGVGKTTLASRVATVCKTKMFILNRSSLAGSKSSGLEQMRLIFKQAKEAALEEDRPTIVFIDELDGIVPSRLINPESSALVAQLLTLMDGIDQAARGQVVIIGATNRPNAIDPALRRAGRFDREIQLKVPSSEARFDLLNSLLKNIPRASDLDVKDWSSKTNGYVMADLSNLVKEACLVSSARNESHLSQVAMQLSFEKLGTPAMLRSSHLTLEKMDWSQVGGVEYVKKQLQQAVEWPLLYKDKMERLGLQAARGILLYGPPGCSKTTLVKILASQANIQFLTMTGASVYSSALGESEASIRSIFTLARSSAPSIVFFDEIDALVGKRGFQDGSRGDSVQERVLSTLLNEMDGIEHAKGVLVVGATNRPDMIDAALLRPGRFGKIIYVPPPNREARKSILEIYTRGMPIDDSVDLNTLADLTDRFSGADLKGVCREAVLVHLRKKEAFHDRVSMTDFLEVLNETIPTISIEMLQQYQDFVHEFGT
jgi:transitional endoplasmic reticulum ATPase